MFERSDNGNNVESLDNNMEPSNDSDGGYSWWIAATVSSLQLYLLLLTIMAAVLRNVLVPQLI